MVRATTRSQRHPASSQGPSNQAERVRHARNQAEETGDEGLDADMSVNEGDLELKRKAHNLARLALFAEQKRMPLKREEISKKVLSQNPRTFNRIFELAQEILQKTFGMELVELQTRASLETDTAQDDDRHATGIKKKAAAVGSKTYILRSVLHPIIIEHAALTDEQILEEEVADTLSDDNDDDELYTSKLYGSLFSWSTVDQLGGLGILYTILSLILVSGRVISDSELRAHLKHLGLPHTGSVLFTAQSTHPTQSVETYLSTLLRHGYLDRIHVGDAKKGGKSRGAKRARLTQVEDENGATYEWRWGSRSQSEVGEKAIARFIAEFMVDPDEDDEGARGNRQDPGSRLEQMTKGIERAAGGQLSDAK